jgi:hypothetical protein
MNQEPDRNPATPWLIVAGVLLAVCTGASVLVLAGFAAFGTSTTATFRATAPVAAIAPPGRLIPADDAAVRQLLDDQLRAWNANDRAAFLATFAAVGPGGKPRPTRWEEEVTKKFFRTFGRIGEGTLTYDDVLSVRDGAGVSVSVSGQFVKDGKPRRGALELTLERVDGRWQIVDEEDIPLE